MVCVAWVFFRAESVGEAVDYLGRALSLIQGTLEFRMSASLLIWLSLLLALEAFSTRFTNRTYRWVIETCGVLLVLGFLFESFAVEENTFIYFQF